MHFSAPRAGHCRPCRMVWRVASWSHRCAPSDPPRGCRCAGFVRLLVLLREDVFMSCPCSSHGEGDGRAALVADASQTNKCLTPGSLFSLPCFVTRAATCLQRGRLKRASCFVDVYSKNEFQ
ncbi:unnamed protein product [Amoebophrya sp. A120]|nr:unnamed protein product [Amoebophrya sp. A120]|eukprot:GSA120T00022356001.1